jgi:hypothetical protein
MGISDANTKLEQEIDPRDADSYTWAVLWEAASRGDDAARAKLDALAKRILWAEER